MARTGGPQAVPVGRAAAPAVIPRGSPCRRLSRGGDTSTRVVRHVGHTVNPAPDQPRPAGLPAAAAVTPGVTPGVAVRRPRGSRSGPDRDSSRNRADPDRFRAGSGPARAGAVPVGVRRGAGVRVRAAPGTDRSGPGSSAVQGAVGRSAGSAPRAGGRPERTGGGPAEVGFAPGPPVLPFWCSRSRPRRGLRRGQALGATLLRPLMMRSIASPPVGSVRLASIFRVNFIRRGWVRPRWVAIFMTFGLPMSFTKARPSV